MIWDWRLSCLSPDVCLERLKNPHNPDQEQTVVNRRWMDVCPRLLTAKLKN